MAKTRKEKEVTVQNVSEILKQHAGVVFAAYSRLSVKDMLTLRRNLKQEQCKGVAVKKTLLARAIQAAGIVYDVNTFDGAIFLSYGNDQATPAKVLESFRKEHPESITMLGGILDHSAVSREQVIALAKLPSRIELTARLVGSIASPISGFVRVLSGTLQGLVYALAAVRDKKSA